jgi:hypothetical protein
VLLVSYEYEFYFFSAKVVGVETNTFSVASVKASCKTLRKVWQATGENWSEITQLKR